MPYVPPQNGYSLTDFHDFDDCKFRFFVRHHLEKKYEIAKGSRQMALGVLLDRSIKEIHKYKGYKHPVDRLVKSIKYSADLITKEEKESKKRPNFNSAVVQFFDEEIVLAAEQVFRNYYSQIQGNFQKSLFHVDFCKWYLNLGSENYVLWGGPDTVEMGKDGIPEVIDYKSRMDIGRGKKYMDMELMSKMYMLLTAKQLQQLGFEKARFKVVFWQDPRDESFAQEFDLRDLKEHEDIFRERIQTIVTTKDFDYCAGQYCDACNYEKKDSFIEELEAKGLRVLTGEEFIEEGKVEKKGDGLFSGDLPF
jgi:hypothetical protein